MARLLSATWLWCYAATALLCDVRISPPRRSAGRRLAATDRDAEPFEIVRSDLKQMKLRIKALVERTLDSGGDSSKSKSHPLLQGAAREFFERRERAFRPAVVLLVSRALQTETEELPARHRLLAEIVEMMCTAQIIHDSVLEDGADSDDGNVAHRLYVSASAGNKVSVLAGDFLLARCSVALSQLGDLNVVELMATSLESMVHGGVLFAQALPVELLERSNYERRTRLKTSALIADACRSAAILAGYDERAEVSEAVFNYATSLGLAYQTIADTIAFEAGECVTLTAFASSPPVILAAERSPELREAILSAAPATSGTALAALIPLVAAQDGVRRALEAGTAHAEAAAAFLAPVPASRYRDALLKMTNYVSQPDQRGLQREKFAADAARRQAEAARTLKALKTEAP